MRKASLHITVAFSLAVWFELQGQTYTASQSSSYSTCSGSYATLTDGLFSNGTGTSNGGSEWIKASFTSAQIVTAVTVAGGNMTSCPWGSVAAYLNGAIIQSSNDNITWTTMATISGVTDANGLNTFPVGCANAMYWRIQKSGYLATTEFSFIFGSPMAYSSGTTTQNNTAIVGAGTTNNEVIGIQIITTGCSLPLDATSFSFNTTGSTSPLTDISNAKLWYTGTSGSFAATTQFGSAIASPNGAFSITGTQSLSSGTNFFWLSYDIPAGATLSNFIDASCSSVIVGSTQTLTIAAPAGNRMITNIAPPTFQCVSSTNCGCNSVSITTPACIATNDLMIAHLTYRANTGDVGITPPAGWARIYFYESSGPQMSADVYYKVASAFEPASYTFTQTSSGSDMTGSILVYRGVSTTDPIEDAGGAPTSGTSHATPCITATTDQAMIVTLFSLNSCSNCNLADVAWIPPAGMNERYDIGKVQSSWKASSGDDVVNISGGCVQKTASSFANTDGIAIIIALRPSGATDNYSTLYRGKNTLFNSGTSLSLAKPASVKQNDLMLVHLSVGSPTGAGATPPAGWNLIRYDNNSASIGTWLYYKVAGASEPSAYTFSVSSGLNLIGAIMAYGGIDPVSPVINSGGTSTSGTSHSTPSVATTSDSAVITTFFSFYGQTTFTPPFNSNERYDYSNAQNHWKTISGNDFILTPAGTSGIVTATSSGSGNGIAQIVALKRLTGPVSGGCCGFSFNTPVVPLQIELLSFSAECMKDDQIKINWTTATELNTDYFEIERRSGLQTGWQTAGQVTSAGNSSAIIHYEFTDNTIEKNGEVCYYRLKQIDQNGKYEYFNAVAVHCLPEDGFLICPNPASESVTLEINLPEETGVNIIFRNLPGQILFNKYFLLSEGNQKINIELSELSGGAYLLEIIKGEKRSNERIIITK